jgi:hypothetical protein
VAGGRYSWPMGMFDPDPPGERDPRSGTPRRGVADEEPREHAPRLPRYQRRRVDRQAAHQHWRVYWQRADLKWHRYDPAGEVNSIDDFFPIVEHDEYACFFG